MTWKNIFFAWNECLFKLTYTLSDKFVLNAMLSSSSSASNLLSKASKKDPSRVMNLLRKIKLSDKVNYVSVKLSWSLHQWIQVWDVLVWFLEWSSPNCSSGLIRVWRSVACLLLLWGVFSWFLYLLSFTITSINLWRSVR